MTIQEALKQMVDSERFRELAKVDAGLRVYAGRIRNDRFSDGAAVRLLQSFGYKINVLEEAGKKK
jgi:hypothetical protein